VRRFTREAGPFLWLIPAFAVIFSVAIFPLVYSLFVSFCEMNLQNKFAAQYIGLGNYAKILEDPIALYSLETTFYFVFVVVLGSIAISICGALLLNEEFAGRGICRAAVIIPWAIAPAVCAVMWRWIFNPTFGLLNAVLYYGLHIIPDYQSWLMYPMSALHAVIVAEIWMAVPFQILVLMAALASVPQDLYQVAKVDGASALQTFRYVVLPHLKNVLLVIIALQTIWEFKAFDIIYLLTRGDPEWSTALFNFYSYKQVFEYFDFGYGAAIAYVVMAITIVAIRVYFRYYRLEVERL
jgi:multiple sugar transport system permease protein